MDLDCSLRIFILSSDCIPRTTLEFVFLSTFWGYYHVGIQNYLFYLGIQNDWVMGSPCDLGIHAHLPLDLISMVEIKTLKYVHLLSTLEY